MLLQLLTIPGPTANCRRWQMPQMAHCTPAGPYAADGMYAADGPTLYAAGGIDAADGTLQKALLLIEP